MFTPKRSVAAAAAGVMLLGACGGGRPSHAAFVARVSAICGSAGHQRQAASQGFDFDSFNPDTSDLEPMIAVSTKNVAIGRDAVRQVRALKGPAADEAKAAEWAGNADRLHQLDDQSIAALRQGDRSAFKALAQREDDLRVQLARTHHPRPGDPVFKDC